MKRKKESGKLFMPVTVATNETPKILPHNAVVINVVTYKVLERGLEGANTKQL
jgi:hypothetical protein